MRLMTGKWHQIGRADIIVRRGAATWMMVMILIDVVEGDIAIGKA